MALIIGSAIALIFFDGLWRILIIGAVALIELVEITVWLRWRKVKVTTGSEGMVGMKGIALTECRTEGQVRVKGQIWKGVCPEGASEGDSILVERIDGLRLTVTRS